MLDREEIRKDVGACLVDALGVEEDEVSDDRSLTADLGAESIDFLDIVFRLEKKFDIKIPRGELFPENLLSDPQYVSDGRLTEEGLKMLREQLPYADLTEFEKDPKIGNIADLFTVGMIVNYVCSKVSA